MKKHSKFSPIVLAALVGRLPAMVRSAEDGAKRSLKLAKMVRSMPVKVRALDAADGAQKRYALSISSEFRVKRNDPFMGEWIEVLDHSPASIDMSRASNLPLLLDHDTRDQVGKVESLQLDQGERRLHGEVRFSRSARGAEVEQDVVDAIRENVSLGYQILELTHDGDEDGIPVLRASRWMPYEVSLVSVPADPTVGVSRAADDEAGMEVTVIEKESDGSAADTDADADKNKADEGERQDVDPNKPAVVEGEGEGEPTAGNAPGAEAESPAAENVPAADGADSSTSNEQERNKDEGDETSEGSASSNAAAGGESASNPAQSSEEDKAERALVTITRQALAAGMGERIADFVQRGLTPEQVAREIVEAKRSSPLPSNSSQRIMTQEAKDAKKFSYARAILVATGDAKGGLEQELHDELSRKLPSNYQSRGGIIVPMSAARTMGQARAMDTKTAAKGGATVQTDVLDLIELLYNNTVALQMGARYMPGLQNSVSFPKVISGTSASWRAENPGSDAPDSELVFGSVGLTPKTLIATTAFSRQLMVQSTTDIESLVRSDIAEQHSIMIDKAALYEGGVNGPVGVYETAGVNAVDFSAGANYALLVEMVAKVMAQNALKGSLGFVTTPMMAHKLSTTLVAQAAGSGFIWSGRLDDGTVAGYKAVATNNMPANLGAEENEHGIIFGNWNDIVIGDWGAMELIVDPYRLKKQGLIEVTSHQLVDVAVRRGESFSKADGAEI